MTYDKLKDFSVDGKITSTVQGELMGTFTAMPTASERYKGKSVQYLGPDGTYSQGSFYICKENAGVYSWEINNPPGSSDVTWTQVTDGLKIASIDINGVPTDVKIPYSSATKDGIISPSQYANISAIPGLTSGLAAEVTRATGAESALSTAMASKADASALTQEITDRTNAVSAEATTARAAEIANATAIATEKSRAEGVESTIITDLATEVTRAKASEKLNADAITAEYTRATGVESGKLNVLGNEAGSGTPYKMTYFFSKAADTNKMTVTAHTITMDNAKTLGTYTMDIPSASTSVAGLMSGADKTRLDAIQLTDASVSGGTLTINKKDGTTVTHTKTSVVDSLTSTSTTDALSAKNGKELNDRIDSLSSMGRFLSMWNSSGGKPYDDPPGTDLYHYKSGDYYIIGNVATTGPNYKPEGSVYNRMTSTTVESDSVHVNDIYRYTTSGWILQSQEEKTVTFPTIAGNPRDNTNLAAEFDKYIPLLGAEPGSGEQYHIPFNINAIVQNADNISTSFDTITLDGNKTKIGYPITIPGANIADNKAGLYTKALADLKADVTSLTAEVTRATNAETALGGRIDDEDARAQGEETRIEGLVTAEVTRATGAEGTLATNLAAEVTNRTNADTALQTGITAETTRATAKEGELQTAINGKISLLGNEAGSGGPYHFTYFYGFTPAADKITAYVDTITLDNTKHTERFHTDIVGASTSAAGLMTAADKIKLDAANIKDASVSGNTLTLTRATGGDVTFVGGPSAYLKSADVSTPNTLKLKNKDNTDTTFTVDLTSIISDSTTGATDKTYSQSKIVALIEALGGTFFGSFDTKAALLAATGMVKNDYAVVKADESQTPIGQTTMYYYTGTAWSFAYVIRTTPLSYKTVEGQSIIGTGNIAIIDDTAASGTVKTYSINKINELTADQDVRANIVIDTSTWQVTGSIPSESLPGLINGDGTLIVDIQIDDPSSGGLVTIGHSRGHITYVDMGGGVPFFNGIVWLDISGTGDSFQPLNLYVNTSGNITGGLSALSASHVSYYSTTTYAVDTVGYGLNKLVSDMSEKAPITGLTDGSVTKVGVNNVGSANTPMYLSEGMPMAGTKVINNVLDGYAIATTARAIAATDKLIDAIAILEKRIKTLEDANLVRYG